MFNVVGLEGKNSDYSELNWKTVSKGKRSRKSVTGSGCCKLASESPNREREFSVSEVERFSEPLTGQLLADGLGCVPFKKRKYVLHSPPSSRNNEPSSPQQRTGSHSEDFEHLSDKNCFSGDLSSDSYSDTRRLANGVGDISDDGIVDDKVSGDTNNLSGIAILADAACFSSFDDNPGAVKGDVTEVSSTLRNCDDTCTSTTPLGESVQCSESESSSHKGTLRLRHENPSSFGEDSSAHTAEENRQGVVSTSISSKVDRRQLGLITIMEACKEPQDDLVVRNSSIVEVSVDGLQKEKLDVEKDFPKGNDVNMYLGPVDILSAISVSKVLNGHELPICQVEDNAKPGGSTLKSSEQQAALPDVAGLDMSRRENNPNAELSVSGTIFVEKMLGKSCKTVSVEKSGISSEGHCRPLCKVEDMSTSDICVVGQSVVCDDGKGQLENVGNDHGDEDHSSQHDTHLDFSVDTVNASIVQDSMKPSVNDDCHEADVFEDDDHGRLDAAENISEILLDYESPYEDGELREPALPSWEDECVDYESDGRVDVESDVGDYPGMEIVEAALEGSHATENNDPLRTEVSGGVTRMSTLGFKKGHDENKANTQTEVKKVSNQGSGTTEELSTPTVQKHDVSMTRRPSFDNTVHTRGSYVRKFGSGITKEKLQGSSPFNVSDRKEDVQFSQNRACRVGDSVSRSERSSGADSSVSRFRSTPYERRQMGGYVRWNYRDSSRSDLFRGPEDDRQDRPRNTVVDFADKFLNSYENNESINISKGIQRPFLRRRSPTERDDYHSNHRKITSRYGRGSSRDFAGRIGWGHRKEYDEPVVDADASSGRFVRYLPRRERSFSPSDKVPHVYAPSRKSRSRSRTGSPRFWQSHRERSLNNRRRCSRSPEFRTEFSVERTRLPFQKVNCAADYGESFISTPKGPFSAKHNNRWVNERNSANRLRHQGSRIEVVSPSQRVDAVGLSRRWKSDDHFRPVVRSGRFSNGDKLGESCDVREQDERLGLVHPSVRRSLHDAHVNFEDDNCNDKDDRDNGPRSISSFADERNFESSPSRRRRTPSVMLRRAKRLESDNYFKPDTQPGRFTTTTGVHWGNELDEKTDYKMQEERSGTIHSMGHSDSYSHLRGF